LQPSDGSKESNLGLAKKLSTPEDIKYDTGASSKIITWVWR
jgi:hypothetical protein